MTKVKSSWINCLWVIIPSITLIVFVLVPFIGELSNSFDKSTATGLNGFSRVANDSSFSIAFGNSVLYMLVPLISLPISIIVSFLIASINNKWIRNNSIASIFIQYLFVSVAIGAAFSFLFQANYGFINSIRVSNGKSPIQWISSDTFMTQVTTIIYLSITSLPLQIALLSLWFIHTDIKYNKVFKSNNIVKSKDKLLIYLSDNRSQIMFMCIFSMLSMLSIYPIALFGGSTTEMFSSNGQTIVGYINYMINIDQIGNASAASIYFILFIFFLSICFYLANRWLKSRYKYA
ncbi:MAG: sugar ABC transporter permease [Mycoplasmataceae bacterium]|nr:sugar ABC transporter permease [Mycoplasmataceae bacterium]